MQFDLVVGNMDNGYMNIVIAIDFTIRTLPNIDEPVTFHISKHAAIF